MKEDKEKNRESAMKVDRKKACDAVRRGTRYAFIPRRLEINGRPELRNFPFNVLFMSVSVKNGAYILGSALYEPEFHTFNKEGHLNFMRYRNAYGGDCQLAIAYDERNKQYRGVKYINGEAVGSADGDDDWKVFFTHLTMIGLVNGEQCKFEPASSDEE